MLQLALIAFLTASAAALTLKLSLFEYDERRDRLIDAVVLLIGICALYFVITH
jgi:hypothetical protein